MYRPITIFTVRPSRHLFQSKYLGLMLAKHIRNQALMSVTDVIVGLLISGALLNYTLVIGNML